MHRWFRNRHYACGKGKGEINTYAGYKFICACEGSKVSERNLGYLKQALCRPGFTRKISLLRTLISLRLDSCDSMQSYVNQVIETSQKLKKTGFDISGEWVGSLLLAGLPEKYAPMIMAIEHSGITIDTDSIKTKLLDMDENSSRGGAFAVKQKNVKKGSGSMNNSKGKQVKCYRCKAFGHYMNKCPKNSTDGEKKVEKGNSALSVFFF